MAAALPPLSTPSAADLLGLLPELILAGGFVLLLLLDLVTSAPHRPRLAAAGLLTTAAALGADVWAWFDAVQPRTLYFGSFAYDRFSIFVNGIILVCTALTLLVSPQYLKRRGIHHGEYYALILGSATGMMFLAGASSLMVVFLAFELLSIALYILSGFNREQPRSQEAALKYLLLGSFASAFLLLGMAFVYGETGHTQFTLIAAALQSAGTSADPLLMGGIVLIFVGLAFKVSAVPFHTWTPDVYQGAPTSVTTFMSVTTKVAAFAALIRLFTYTFGEVPIYSRWKAMVYFVAIASMVVGNVAALRQTSLKRVLAYSGIAQAGYILIGVVVLERFATVAALYYLAAYAVTNIGAFAVITVMSGRGEDMDSYDSLRGLSFRRPYVAAAMSLFLLSLAGFPPTAGFFGKFFVFTAAISAHEVPLALWGIGTSAISVFYYLRIALLMYTRPGADGRLYSWSRTSLAGGTVLALTGVGTVAIGVFTFLVLNLAALAQHGILPAGVL